jgi:hypothetical protein
MALAEPLGGILARGRDSLPKLDAMEGAALTGTALVKAGAAITGAACAEA